MPALTLADAYCSTPGQAPAQVPDWAALRDAVRTEHPPTYDDEGNEDDSAYDAAMASLGAQRLATVSHLARNGRGVVVEGVARLSPLEVDLVGVPDDLGGYELRSHGLLVTCPECGEPVRMLP